MSILDTYERRARLQPALIAASPVAIAVAAAGFALHPLLAVVLGGMTEIGLTVLLAEFARRLGKRLEPELWASWGGPPTTSALRHGGPTHPHRRTLAHVALGRLVPDIQLPDEHEEREHPDDADARYELATEVARNLLRNEPVGDILGAENRNYGFHRNLLGLRPIGLAVSTLTLAAAVVASFAASSATGRLRCGLVAAACGSLILFWWLYVRPERARWAAERYAEAFIGAVTAAGRSN